jgi:hypothetical protein
MSHRDLLHLNEHGELSQLGPSWACDLFGTTGHDYYRCPHCLGNYQNWLSRIYKPRQVSI